VGFSPGFGGDLGPPTSLPGNIGSPGGGDWLSALVQVIYSILIAVANFLWAIIKALVGILVQLFESLAKFLKHVWEHYVKAAITWLAQHARQLYDWLHRHIKTTIAFLQKLKRWYDQHILPFQLKQLALIQHIRQVLGILKAFHVKWATQLDAKLGDLQQKIVLSIETVRGALNSVINFANLIFDPSLLIRRTALGGSLLNSLGALKRITGFGSNTPLNTKQQAQVDHWQSYYTKSETLSYMATVAATGPTSEDRQLDSDARDSFSAVTGVAQ
jgi:hypothetical protein